LACRCLNRKASLTPLRLGPGFHGWEASAAWEDTKFGIKHFADIERLAMVGDKEWQDGMALFCKPFTKAMVRYFDHAEAVEARKWLAQYGPNEIEEKKTNAFLKFLGYFWGPIPG
jgi:hypothetical protein